jgi:hypothetical protein
VPGRLWIALAAALGVGLTYFDSLNLGLWWDDYLMLRPSSMAEVARAFHGTWEPTGTFPAFYRPLTVAYQALVFHVLGFHPVAIHVLSLALLVTIAWLVGLFVAREGGSPRHGAIAAAIYGAHPAVARSEGPWFFLQYHSLGSIVVILALLAWQARRERPSAPTWWPIAVLATVGFLIQESLIMLMPAVVLLQTARARFVRDVPAPPPALWAVVAIHAFILLGARQLLLDGLGGPPAPQGLEWLVNLIRGPVRTLAVFQPGHWPANVFASIVSVLVLVTGAWALARTDQPRARGLMLTGIVVLAAFNAPLILASSSARFHLLAMGAVLMLAGALAGYDGYGRYGRYVGYGRYAGYAAAALLVCSFALASRAAIEPQRPCGPENLETDADVMTWTAVPVELREWLARKAEACARGVVLDDLPRERR